MKLWQLYVKHGEIINSTYYFIPIKVEGTVHMYRSLPDYAFDFVKNGTTKEEGWPEKDIVTNGEHTHKALKLIFQHGVE